jgi:hypothetical protein
MNTNLLAAASINRRRSPRVNEVVIATKAREDKLSI